MSLVRTSPPDWVKELVRNHHYIHFDHWAPVQATWGGRRTAGFADSPRGGCRSPSCPVAVNGIFEVCPNDAPVFPWVNPPGTNLALWDLPITIIMVQNMANNPSTVAGEVLQGIEIGCMQQLPPWQTNFAAADPCIQLRWNSTSARWEIMIYDGDGVTAPDLFACDINPAWGPDLTQKELILRWIPNPATGNNVMEAYINGVLAKRLTTAGTPRLANFQHLSPSALANLGGYFMTNGSNAAAQRTEGGFYGGIIFIPFAWGA